VKFAADCFGPGVVRKMESNGKYAVLLFTLIQNLEIGNSWYLFNITQDLLFACV